MSSPTVSVVMSVYNGAATLHDSVRSILSQQGVEFEFVIVNDGSTDASTGILDELARADRRIRVIHQDNRGLTRALIVGCAAASGAYIARQDADDLSLPDRLRNELAVIEAHRDAVLVSCGTRFVGPKRELLYEKSHAGDATDGLLTLDWEQLRGPAGHGSTLFRRDFYNTVGGYREQFYFAQDLDLWTRLVEHGRYITIPEVLYEVSVALTSISSLQRRRQIECARSVLEAARLRRTGLDESPALARATAILPDRQATAAAADRAAALYFVGVCLRNRSDPRARQYFRDAWRANRMHLKSAVRLLMR